MGTKRIRGSNGMAEQIARGRKAPPQELPRLLLPSGSTLLNLACADTHTGAWPVGKVVTLPGGSSTGKTMFILTAFAEGMRMQGFDGHTFVYDDTEAALEFDVESLFGTCTAKRIQTPPNGVSSTVQDFQSNILSAVKQGKPFVYALDSWDSLSSDEELNKEMRKALQNAKSKEAMQKIAGSYGAEKAKTASKVLRMIVRELATSRSILLLVQQLRQKMNSGPFSSPYTTSGGEAPFFYSSHQVWLTKVTTTKSKGRKVGITADARVLKNKYTGKLRDVRFDIRYDYGIDDIGSCVDFLVQEGMWRKDGQKIRAVGLDLEGARDAVIRKVENHGLEERLRMLTARTWHEVEQSIRTTRKARFK